ncbi:amino acid ABC transporter permease [Nocardioides plantarum]|uniref:Amino acid ABC transporter permease n=1 Tax=Nocardioides plantarum TaxID=29299 RepID=A0ABV5K984_9ACTN|nr:amino acid ABC transporter permease [Nocardioides plantarum]
MTSVLYDEPGPRGRLVNRALSVVALLLLLAVGYWVYAKLDETDQWASEKWKPLFEGEVWSNFFIPGIEGTLKAFGLASVLAVVFGLVFGMARMSTFAPVRWVGGIVVEFFRSVPLLILMFAIYYLWSITLGYQANIYMAVVLGLMLYNGSVLAEVLRAGVASLPSGQAEAGLAIGLRRTQVMLSIQLPQAVRAMLPAIIAQLVVLLKDTALGYILAYNELVNQVNKVSRGNTLQVIVVVALIFILMNCSLSGFASWLEKRLGRTSRSSGGVTPVDPTGLVPGGALVGRAT